MLAETDKQQWSLESVYGLEETLADQLTRKPDNGPEKRCRALALVGIVFV